MDKYAAMEWVKRGVGNLTEEEFDNAVNTYHTRYGKNPLELNIKAYTYSAVNDLVNFVEQNRRAESAAAAPPTGGRRRRSRRSRKSRKNKSSRR